MLQEYRDHRTSCCSNSRSVFYLSRVFRCRALLQYKGSSILCVYNFFPSRVDTHLRHSWIRFDESSENWWNDESCVLKSWKAKRREPATANPCQPGKVIFSEMRPRHPVYSVFISRPTPFFYLLFRFETGRRIFCFIIRDSRVVG